MTNSVNVKRFIILKKIGLFLGVVFFSVQLHFTGNAGEMDDGSKTFFREDFQSLDRWKPLEFKSIKKHTNYTVQKEGGESLLKMESNNSASGIVQKKTFNLGTLIMKPINVRQPAENFLDELNVFSEYQLDSCFGDGECMRVCPVVDQKLTIAELNESTSGDNPLTTNVRKFAFDCIQCGQCTTACPGGVQRDVLMLKLKLKLKHKALLDGQPKHHKSYFKAKGISGWDPDNPQKKSLGKTLTIKGFNIIAGSKLGKLRRHVDKTEF